uniref:Uncharacterized protein n=1 Tax=virus sp. ctBM815 TaxID=2825806 RepID=A0A8S5RL79_9VIRU|nr:MAG TPA: hypothetical protein [virus sp. ctBM815]
MQRLPKEPSHKLNLLSCSSCLKCSNQSSILLLL